MVESTRISRRFGTVSGTCLSASLLSIIGLVACSGRSQSGGNMNITAETFGDPRMVNLAKAIDRDNSPEVDQAVRVGASPNGKGRGGMTPLIYAGAKRKKNAMRELLKLGADPNQFADGNVSAMMLAAGSDDADLLRIMLDGGGNPNLTNDHGEPVTFTAARQQRWENLKLLLERGADINGKDRAGYTLTLFLAEVDRYEWVYRLLEMGADMNAKDSQGWTLAHYVQTSRLASGAEQGQWKLRVTRFLEERGIKFPVAAPSR